jgi:hypothetical protein
VPIGSIASGTFTNCVGGEGSFGCGDGGEASGQFTNCTAHIDSFGGYGGTLSGTLSFCKLLSGTFPTVAVGGITRYCLDGNNATNNQG